jgi:NADPH:quinone reductase-like Zn-dependent oxidoreductase
MGGMDRWTRGLLLSVFIGQSFRPVFASIRQEDLLPLKELAETKAITPVIDRTYPVDVVADAIRHLEKGHPRGKLVVIV